MERNYKNCVAVSKKITNKILEVNGLIIQCLAAFEICEVLLKYLLASLSM